MYLENIMFSEIKQIHKLKYCMVSLTSMKKNINGKNDKELFKFSTHWLFIPLCNFDSTFLYNFLYSQRQNKSVLYIFHCVNSYLPSPHKERVLFVFKCKIIPYSITLIWSFIQMHLKNNILCGVKM